jgi:light-regulated signal transduction histidine kinase (bacteriophytochrome)
MLNILDDLTEEKSRMSDTQQAVLNVLADIADEKQHLELIPRAVLNILEDFDEEAKQRRLAESEVRLANATLESRVSDRTKRLELANKDLESFSYSVSHDLRAPLRAVDGFSRILLEDYAGKLDAEGQRVLNVIREGTAKMSRMIDDILQFSRAGRTEITPTPVDMSALVQTAIGDLKAASAGRTINFEIGALPIAYGDSGTLQRVWTNLLDNAVKYTGPKSDARIEIGATPGAAETVYFVRDNGVGFDMQYADKLFGVFQRLHGGEFAGTGIGLAIIKRIINRHGGRVWAQGVPNVGATFYFSLPVRETQYVRA